MALNFKSLSIPFSIVFLVLILMPRMASSHRVNVFCWVEGNRVKCEAKFTPGGTVKGGKIEVFALQTGERLLQTTTDQDGRAEFEIPSKAVKNRWDLKVVCNAEMGHKNYWVVRAEELPSGESEKVPIERKEQLQAPAALSAKDLEEIYARVLRSQLTPIKRDIAELKANRITLQDILGGLGYILGLAGIAFYVLGKKEKQV